MAIRTQGKAARLATMSLLCTLLGCPQGGVLIDEPPPDTTLGSAFFPDEGENVVVGAVRFLWVARNSSESTIRISKDDDPSFVIQRTIPAIPGAEEYVELIQITQPGGYSWVLEIRNVTGGLTTGRPRNFTVLICNSDTMCQEQDGIFCNGAEVCVDGFCLPGALPTCSDGIDCTLDFCDAATDACIHIPDNGLCDDNLFCNGSEACDPINGCQPGATPYCDDQVACTVDSCDEANDTCLHAPNNAACDDGVFCNGPEVCESLQGCRPGASHNCDDGVSCTVDSCNEASDACVHAPNHSVCNDGQICNGIELCNPSAGCQAGTPPQCDDGIFCNGAEACNPLTGTCNRGQFPCPNACDEDSNTCLATCTASSQCNDGLFCNGEEFCLDGCAAGTCAQGLCGGGFFPCENACDEDTNSCLEVCTGSSQCDDGLFCNGAEICETDIGLCLPGEYPCSEVAPFCNEISNICLTYCERFNCDDGLFCNGTETCSDLDGGSCQAGLNPCSLSEPFCDEEARACSAFCTADGQCQDSLFCNGIESCNQLTGACERSAHPCPNACDEDVDACLDLCITDSHCDDGLFCNGAEFCRVCRGCSPGTCASGTFPCQNACDENADVCLAVCTLNSQCDDGLFCNGVETCQSGQCQAGVNPCPPSPFICNERDKLCESFSAAATNVTNAMIDVGPADGVPDQLTPQAANYVDRSASIFTPDSVSDWRTFTELSLSFAPIVQNATVRVLAFRYNNFSLPAQIIRVHAYEGNGTIELSDWSQARTFVGDTAPIVGYQNESDRGEIIVFDFDITSAFNASVIGGFSHLGFSFEKTFTTIVNAQDPQGFSALNTVSAIRFVP